MECKAQFRSTETFFFSSFYSSLPFFRLPNGPNPGRRAFQLGRCQAVSIQCYLSVWVTATSFDHTDQSPPTSPLGPPFLNVDGLANAIRPRLPFNSSSVFTFLPFSPILSLSLAFLLGHLLQCWEIFLLHLSR